MELKGCPVGLETGMERGSGTLLVEANEVSYCAGSGKLRGVNVSDERMWTLEGTHAEAGSSRAMLRVDRPGEACMIMLKGPSKSFELKLNENHARGFRY
jgi:hypothetical protein